MIGDFSINGFLNSNLDSHGVCFSLLFFAGMGMDREKAKLAFHWVSIQYSSSCRHVQLFPSENDHTESSPMEKFCNSLPDYSVFILSFVFLCRTCHCICAEL